MSSNINLKLTPAGFEGLITHIESNPAFRKKLMSLGLRKGQQISVLHQRQGGVVVMCNGSRVALDANIAAKIQLKPLLKASLQTDVVQS